MCKRVAWRLRLQGSAESVYRGRRGQRQPVCLQTMQEPLAPSPVQVALQVRSLELSSPGTKPVLGCPPSRPTRPRSAPRWMNNPYRRKCLYGRRYNSDAAPPSSTPVTPAGLPCRAGDHGATSAMSRTTASSAAAPDETQWWIKRRLLGLGWSAGGSSRPRSWRCSCGCHVVPVAGPGRVAGRGGRLRGGSYQRGR